MWKKIKYTKKKSAPQATRQSERDRTRLLTGEGKSETCDKEPHFLTVVKSTKHRKRKSVHHNDESAMMTAITGEMNEKRMWMGKRDKSIALRASKAMLLREGAKNTVWTEARCVWNAHAHTNAQANIHPNKSEKDNLYSKFVVHYCILWINYRRCA